MSDQQVGKFDELLTPEEVAGLFDCKGAGGAEVEVLRRGRERYERVREE